MPSFLTDSQRDFLIKMAKKYIWWKTDTEAMAYPYRVITQVMNWGVNEDVAELESLFHQDLLIEAISQSRIGEFTQEKWEFWHLKLGISKDKASIPPMPKRIVE